jgi:hypothetical protein
MTLRVTNLTGCAAKTRRFGGADFDGVNDYAARGADLTGNADTRAGTCSFWCRLDGGNAGSLYVLSNTNNRLIINRNSGNNFFFRAQNSAGTATYDFRSTTTYTASASILHVMASWNTNFSAGNKVAHLYVNNVSDLTAVADAAAAFDIDYTTADWFLGQVGGGSGLFDGCLYEVFFHNTFIDLSVAANRAKFITPDLRPVPMGDTGSLPLGVQPLIYQRVLWGADPSTFVTNRGSGGDFTLTGTLTKASTNPPNY